jgi:hypothetical protein
MSQQSVRQAARRSALDAQAERRKQRADRERRLEGLAVAVLTALGERDTAVRGADSRAGGGAANDDRRRRPVAAGGGRAGHVSLGRLRGGRAGHVNEERIGGGRMDHTVPIFFFGYAGIDIGRDNGEVADLRPETRLPSPSRDHQIGRL